jgi:NADPH2:quinone reductase
MRAVRIAAIGGPEQLQIDEVPTPEPGPGEIRVEVAAAGVNYIDTYHRSGIYSVDLPFTPGLEGAGTVTAVGGGVTDRAVGDRVAWPDTFGSYADEVIVSANRSVPIPEGVATDMAAAAMLQGLTAQYLTSSTFPLEAGQRCLIHAGAGGVGRLLIQMAKSRGAEVFTTVSTPAKAELARSAGADHVIRYDEEDFVAAVEAIAGPAPLDVVYDGVGASTFDGGLRLLAPRGLMALFGQSSGVVPPFDLGRLAAMGSLFVTRPTLFTHIADAEELTRRSRDLFAAMESGDLDIMVGHRWPLADAAAAHLALQGRATSGKILLIP